MPTKDLIQLTSGFLCTYLIKFAPHCKKLTIQSDSRNIKSFVGIQLQRNWLNACHLEVCQQYGGLTSGLHFVSVLLYEFPTLNSSLEKVLTCVGLVRIYHNLSQFFSTEFCKMLIHPAAIYLKGPLINYT